MSYNTNVYKSISGNHVKSRQWPRQLQVTRDIRSYTNSADVFSLPKACSSCACFVTSWCTSFVIWTDIGDNGYSVVRKSLAMNVCLFGLMLLWVVYWIEVAWSTRPPTRTMMRQKQMPIMGVACSKHVFNIKQRDMIDRSDIPYQRIWNENYSDTHKRQMRSKLPPDRSRLSYSKKDEPERPTVNRAALSMMICIVRCIFMN